jgi:heavy metal sensor kinase
VFRPRNVRLRLTLAYVTVFGLILLIFVLGATMLQYVQLKRQMYHAEVQDVETTEGLLSFSAAGELKLDEQYHNHPQHLLLLDRYMEVLTPYGKLLLRNAKLQGQSLGDVPPRGEGVSSYNERTFRLGDKTTLLLISHVHSIGNTPLLIRLGYSLEPVQERTRDFLGLLLLAVPFALAIAGFASYQMAFHSLRPVEEMASRAQTITANDLSQRLPVDNPHDEFGHMATVFNEMLRRLEGSFDNLKHFTADASHELRTPLASLRSVGEVGLQRSKSPEEYRNIIGSMLEEVSRLTHMVDGLLTISRADAGQVTLERSVFSVVGLAEEVVSLLTLLAEEKNQKIEVYGDRSVLVNADRTVLQRALGNIVENAIKYSPTSAAISIAISDEAHESNGFVSLEIEDQGPVIPSALQDRVFDRFFRIDESRSREAGGTGLGLAIAKWGVQANGGNVSVEPGRRGGNVFKILVPRFHPEQ